MSLEQSLCYTCNGNLDIRTAINKMNYRYATEYLLLLHGDTYYDMRNEIYICTEGMHPKILYTDCVKCLDRYLDFVDEILDHYIDTTLIFSIDKNDVPDHICNDESLNKFMNMIKLIDFNYGHTFTMDHNIITKVLQDKCKSFQYIVADMLVINVKLYRRFAIYRYMKTTETIVVLLDDGRIYDADYIYWMQNENDLAYDKILKFIDKKYLDQIDEIAITDSFRTIALCTKTLDVVYLPNVIVDRTYRLLN